MAFVLSAVEVINEGQLTINQFPNVGSTDTEWTDWIDTQIMFARVWVQRQIGGSYSSTDATVSAMVKEAVKCVTLSRCWQQIVNVMTGYDAEAMPPELVDIPAAERQRDYYMDTAKQVIALYDTDASDDVLPGGNMFAMPVFGAVGVEDEEHVNDWLTLEAQENAPGNHPIDTGDL